MMGDAEGPDMKHDLEKRELGSLEVLTQLSGPGQDFHSTPPTGGVKSTS